MNIKTKVAAIFRALACVIDTPYYLGEGTQKENKYGEHMHRARRAKAWASGNGGKKGEEGEGDEYTWQMECSTKCMHAVKAKPSH